MCMCRLAGTHARIMEVGSHEVVYTVCSTCTSFRMYAGLQPSPQWLNCMEGQEWTGYSLVSSASVFIS